MPFDQMQQAMHSISMLRSASHACLSAGQHLADPKHLDAQPQATQALPPSTHAQMHASCSAEPSAQLTPRLEKLPIYGPRLPDRTRPHKRSLKASTLRSTQPAERADVSAWSQPPAADQAKLPAASGPESTIPQPPSAKRIKSQEGAQSQQLDTCMLCCTISSCAASSGVCTSTDQTPYIWPPSIPDTPLAPDHPWRGCLFSGSASSAG